MICPKCFTIEKEDGLRCHKCGAQLQTGVFRQPLPAAREMAPPETGARFSRRTSIIVMAVLVVAAVALLLILAALDAQA